MLETLRTACAFVSFPLKARSEGVSAQTALWVLCQPGDAACASSDSAPAAQQLLQPMSWNVPGSCCPRPDPPVIPSSAPQNSWKRCSFPGRAETRDGDPRANAAGSAASESTGWCWHRLCLWKHPYLGEKDGIQLHSSSRAVMRAAREGRLKSVRVQPLCSPPGQKWSLPHARQESPYTHGVAGDWSSSCCPMMSCPYARHPSPLSRHWKVFPKWAQSQQPLPYTVLTKVETQLRLEARESNTGLQPYRTSSSYKLNCIPPSAMLMWAGQPSSLGLVSFSTSGKTFIESMWELLRPKVFCVYALHSLTNQQGWVFMVLCHFPYV